MEFMRIIAITAGAAIVALFLSRAPHGFYRNRQTSRETIEVSDKILGVGIGSPLQEAHAKLDALRDSASTGLSGKESDEGEGEKVYWRLVGTDYIWIMAWANKEGRVVQLSAAVRPAKSKSFHEIGDLSRASINHESAAKWNVQRADHLSYRLIARGPDRHADNIYMIATSLER
jgi:hypothetical protein